MKKWLASLSVAMGVGAVAWGLPLGLRFAAWGARDTGLSAKDYIQDGLVAMWDGIENAGWGKHDENATNWVDLVGTCDFYLTANGGWTNNAFVCNGLSATNETGITLAQNYQQEAAVDWFASRAYNTYYNLDKVNIRQGLMFLWEYAMPGGGAEAFKVQETRDYSAPPEFHTFSYSALIFGNSKNINGGFKNGYLDGVAQSNVRHGNWYSSWYETDYVSYASIGAQVWNDNVDATFKGKIYCIRVYNRPLTDEEVKHNYEVDKARFGAAVDAE